MKIKMLVEIDTDDDLHSAEEKRWFPTGYGETAVPGFYEIDVDSELSSESPAPFKAAA